jgi:hypothetical protein
MQKAIIPKQQPLSCWKIHPRGTHVTAPPHHANPVKAFSEHQFPGKWTGTGGPYRMVTRFDPFRFLSMGVHKGLGVPKMWANCIAIKLHFVRQLHQWRCKTLGERRSIGWTSVGPPKAHMCRSTEGHQNLGIFWIFQCSSHVTVYISSGNIKFCCW